MSFQTESEFSSSNIFNAQKSQLETPAQITERLRNEEVERALIYQFEHGLAQLRFKKVQFDSTTWTVESKMRLGRQRLKNARVVSEVLSSLYELQQFASQIYSKEHIAIHAREILDIIAQEYLSVIGVEELILPNGTTVINKDFQEDPDKNLTKKSFIKI